MAAPTTTKSNKPAQVAPLAAAKVAAAKSSAAPTKVTPLATATPQEPKVRKSNRADRAACAAQRKGLGLGDKIVKGKANDTGNGSLRSNIVNAIQASKTVGAAVVKQVTGGKYTAEAPYQVKKVDVGFALGNGYITITK